MEQDKLQQTTNQTSSSFDLYGGISSTMGDINKLLGSQPGTNLQPMIQKLVNQLSQQSDKLTTSTEEAKQKLEQEKQSAINLAKSFLETEQEKTLSALGLKTGIGSLVLESLNDIQRRNAASLANLASQYDTAIANLDLQAAQNIRSEILNSLNMMAQLENMQYNRNLQVLSLAAQLNQQQTQTLLENVNNILSGVKAKSLDELPEKQKTTLLPIFDQIDKVSGLPTGTTKMKFERFLSSGFPIENAKYITTSDGGIYLVGTRNGQFIYEQLKAGTPKTSLQSLQQFDVDSIIDQQLSQLLK